MAMSHTLPSFGVFYIPLSAIFIKIQTSWHDDNLYSHLVIALQSFDDQYFNYNCFFFIVKIFRLVYILNKLDLLSVVYYIYIARDYSSHSLLYR